MINENHIKHLTGMGLSMADATAFLKTLLKIKPTGEDEAAFDRECENAMPFEGGMSFVEAIVTLRRVSLSS